MPSLFNAILFVATGLVVFVVALLVILRALPGNLWKEAVQERNVSAAIVLAGITLAIGWIVAAAVH